MLKFGNKEFNNLQEQVLENANEILAIKQGLGTALPNPIEGPQGPQGQQGPQGIQGVRGTKWTLGSNLPAGGNEGDLHCLFTGELYQYTNGRWILQTSIKGPQGPVGNSGPQGPQGIQGPQGQQGPQGLTGTNFQLYGPVTTTDELPSPETVSRDTAYLLGSTAPYSIYVIADDNGTLLWTNAGSFASLDNIQIVTIDAPEDATSGTFNDTEMGILLGSDALISLDQHIYHLTENNTFDGYLTFTSIDNDKIYTITVLTVGSWTKTTYPFLRTINVPNYIYGTDSQGEQTYLEYSKIFSQGNTIAVRLSTGALAVNTPTEAHHATHKMYVDNLYNNNRNEIVDIKTALFDTILDIETYDSPDNSGVVTVPERVNSYKIVNNQKAQISEIKGRTWNKNQLLDISSTYVLEDNGITASVDSSLKTISYSGTATAQTSADFIISAFNKNNLVNGNKYIILFNKTGTDGGATYFIQNLPPAGTTLTDSIRTANGTSMYGSITILAGSQVNFTIKPQIIDLTKMFGVGNEPTTVEEFNQLTQNIDFDTYDEGTIINTNITNVKIYDDSSSLLSTETLTVSDLNGVGTAQDSVVWSGTTRTESKVIGKVDLGSLNWVSGSTGNVHCFEASGFSGFKIFESGELANIVCVKYTTDTSNVVYAGSVDKTISISTVLRINDSSYNNTTDLATFKSSLSGVYLYYELSTPTTTSTTEEAVILSNAEVGGSIDFDSICGSDIKFVVYKPREE